MTIHGEVPTRSNRRDWTAYERSRDAVGFDHDACSDMAAAAIWPGIADVEDLTMLAGLSSVSSESDKA